MWIGMSCCRGFGCWNGRFEILAGRGPRAVRPEPSRTGRDTELAAVTAAEVGGAAEAGGGCHGGHAEGAFEQQLAGPLQPQTQIVLRRRAVEKTLAQPFQLTQGDMRPGGQLLR